MTFKDEMLSCKVWAVAGANINPDKFGNKIYKRLKENNYEVYAVNPMYDIVEGDRCYKDLSSLPKVPEVLNMVVSPKRAIPLIVEAANLGIKYIWFQPETYNEETVALVKELKIIPVFNCVLVEVT